MSRPGHCPGLADEEFDFDGVDFDDVDDHIQENLADDVVREALAKGVDLRLYSRQVETLLWQVEQDAVGDYVQESVKISQLDQRIKSCDQILGTMESTLGQFQSDLGSISGEIQKLQDRSLSMNVKLVNRKAVHDKLNVFVGGMAVSDTMVDTICNGPIDDAFLAALADLDKRLAYVKQQPDMRSTVEADQRIRSLVTKATTRLQDFIVQKIHAVRRPMSNLQMQQNTLVKFRAAFRFLTAHSRQVATAIKQEYIETFSKVHWSYFNEYVSRLMRLQYDDMTDKDDLMGAEDVKRMTFLSFSMRPLKNRSTVFTIGNRATILGELTSPILIPHTARNASAGKDTKYPYETLFRSVQFAMMDNSAREYLFCLEFFGMPEERALKFFGEVMIKTISMLVQHEKDRIATWYDSISLVLCAKIISEYQRSLRKALIPCLEPYYAHLLRDIWPRFEHIVQLNVESIKQVNPSKLPSLDPRPHYIVRRYAEYSSALLLLNEGADFPQITTALGQLRQEVANFILRMAAEFSERCDQLIFLINNYDMMLSVYGERTTATSVEVNEFEGLLRSSQREFAEEELAASFGGIMAFVKEAASGGATASPNYGQARIEQLTKSFKQQWKQSVEKIDANVMRSFTNFQNGTKILEIVLTQLVIFYDKFTKILKENPYRRPGGWPDLIDRHHVLIEVKKHKTAF